MIEDIYKLLLEEAQLAFTEGEVPVSAAIVYKGKVIAKAHNLKEKNNSVLSHAELLVINKVNKKLTNWRLPECDIYISLEPCPMCASAIQQSRFANVFYFTKRQDGNINQAIINKIFESSGANRKINANYIDLGDDFQQLLKKFFENRRK